MLNIPQIREQFPALNQARDGNPAIFFDGPGGSQVPLSVCQAMTDYLLAGNANLGGPYFSSQATTKLMIDARTAAADLLNATSSDSIIFGPNMTSLTFNISRSISRDWQPGDEIIVTGLDHYSNVSSWQQAAKDKGVIVHQVNINAIDCTLDVDHLQFLLSHKTRLVAVTHASNTTGSLVDVHAISRMAHQVGALVYVDAVHFAPHHRIDVQAIGCDFLACSAYKFYGPHLGILYMDPKWVRTLDPFKVEPATNDGPGRFETGTQSFEALAGFINSVDYLASLSGGQATHRRKMLDGAYHRIAEYEQTLSEHFLTRISLFKQVKLHGISDVARLSQRTPTFALTIEGKNPDEVAQYFATRHMCIGNGHFYAQGLCEQLGLMDKGGVIRVGMMHYNTLQEIDLFMTELAAFLK